MATAVIGSTAEVIANILKSENLGKAILGIDRESAIKLFLDSDSWCPFPLDFTREHLEEFTTDDLRHTLGAAVLQKKYH